MSFNLGAGLQGFGGAVQSVFGALGDQSEASAYRTAASIASGNAQITATSTAIQEAQAQRKLFQVSGAQQAEVAGAGFSASGSSADIFRNTATQGALNKELLYMQGRITENSYEAQAASYTSMAKAASGSGILGAITGVAKAGLGVASAFGF